MDRKRYDLWKKVCGNLCRGQQNEINFLYESAYHTLDSQDVSCGFGVNTKKFLWVLHKQQWKKHLYTEIYHFCTNTGFAAFFSMFHWKLSNETKTVSKPCRGDVLCKILEK